MFEVVRATKQTAWELFVVGRRCTAPADGSRGCVRTETGGTPTGWSMYSVERFFFAPLVYGVKCESSTLALQTHAAIKESRAAPGTVAVRDAAGRTLAAVAFRWEPYWLVTSLTVALPAMYAGRASDVVVANEWGDETRVEVTCSV